jgi:hypothetical protein
MAIAIIGDAPNRAMYERVTQIMFPNGIEPVEGGIAHSAGEGANGTVRIVDIWESREAYDRFRDERLLPAMQEAGIEMSGGGPEFVELFELYVDQEARV